MLYGHMEKLHKFGRVINYSSINKLITMLTIYRYISGGIFSLFNLPLAEIVDKDLLRYNRRYCTYIYFPFFIV